MGGLSTEGPIGNDSVQGDLGSVDDTPATEDTTPVEPDGQPTEPDSQAATADADPTTTEPEDTFTQTFDPESIKDSPELQKAFKQMQGDYTRKTSEISGIKKYAPLIESFQNDPVGTLQKLNQQYGIGQEPAPDNQGPDFENFDPQNWGDVVSALKQAIMPELSQSIGQKYQPVYDKVQEMTKTDIETKLDKVDPEWRNYQANMQAVLQHHPTMVNDVKTLYRMSVPQDQWEAKATQAALKKLKSAADGSRVSGASQTKTVPSDGPKRGATWEESIAYAKADMARNGIVKP